MTLQFRGRLELLLPHSRPPCRYDSTHRETVCTAVSRIRVEGADLSGSPVCAYSILVGLDRCAWGRYTSDNGRHPYRWRLGSTGNNGANFPPSPSILVGILYYHPVYIRTVHPRIYIHTLAQRCVRCVDTQSGTSCPTNWDLSLLLVVMEAMP